MKKSHKRFIAWLAVLMMVVGMLPAKPVIYVMAAGADNALIADDLADETITSDKTVGMFTIKATADKAVTVDGNSKTADDGTSFTKRIKLGGAGTATERSIHFSVSSAATVTVYAMSSSSSADRKLALYTADGTLVADVPALGAEVKVGTLNIEAAGDYYLASPESGVNVYGVIVEETVSDMYLAADDLEKKDYTESFTVNGFTVNATSEKGVTVDENAKTADDGESFTLRLKLNGTGAADYRSIHFTAAAASKVTVYAMSGSSSADRELGLFTEDGAEVSVGTALGASLSAITFDVAAGDYYIASKGSGINVYAIKVSAGGKEVVRSDWSTVKAPAITEVKADGNNAVVSFTLVMGDDGADKAEVACINAAGETVSTVMVGKSKDEVKTATVGMTQSGEYTFVVTAMRNDEETVIKSEAASLTYVLPLKAPEIRVKNAGNAVLHVEWNEVSEAEKYVVEYTDAAGKTVTAAEVTALEADITGLKAESKYDVTVTAVRGEDKAVSEAVTKKAKLEADRFEFTYFGQSVSSSVNFMEMIDEDNLKLRLYSCSVKDDGTIDKKGGKFTTSFHDGITYYYTVIDPETENFELTATFTLDYINTTPDGQEGFGLIAMDSLGEYGVASTNHYTNSASVIASKFEATIDDVKYTCKDTIGWRFVSGVTEEAIAANSIATTAVNKQGAYDYMPENLVKQGESYTLTLKKTNTGYHAIYNGEEYIMYGVDKLLQIDKDHIYVGFAVARGCNVTVSDVTLIITDPATDAPAMEEPMEEVAVSAKFDAPSTTSDKNYTLVFNATAPGTVVFKDSKGKTIGKAAAVEAGKDVTANVTLSAGSNTFTAEYTPQEGYKPADNQVLASYETITVKHTVNYKEYSGSTIYVSQNGTKDGAGTKSSPLDIYTALAYAKAGQSIVLAEGTYELTKAIKIERGNDGTEEARKVLTVEDGKRAVLNFSKADAGMQVWGDYWLIENIDVCETPGNVKGLQIAGSYNIVSQVNTYRNGDTGLQISGSGSETYDKWPAYNLILNCTSYDNCDPGMNNADGFAAKLTCAEGNVFRGCIAYNNLDDGWDLFAKMESGPIGAVTVENCIAYRNGTLTNGTGNGDGNGFKLGGDGIAVAHVLRNCVSFENNTAGITSNSNPALIVENCITYGNKGYNITLYGKGSVERTFAATGIISMNGGSDDNYSEMPSLASDVNYFFAGGKTANVKGEVLTSDIFVSTDTSKLPTRAADGSIEMNGLFELKDTAPAGVGAVLKATPLDESVRPEVKEDTYEIYVVKSGDYLRKIAKQLFGSESSWKSIYEVNRDQIKNPDLIYIGMKLKIYK